MTMTNDNTPNPDADLEFRGGIPPAEQKPIPAEGQQDMLCVGVVDWGDMLSDFPGAEPEVNHAVRFFFELGEKIPAEWTDPEGRIVRPDPAAVGKPFMLSTFPIAIKYSPKSRFVKMLKDWLGARDFPERLAGYPLAQLKGRMASGQVEWRRRDDGTFAAALKSVARARPDAKPWPPVNLTLPAWVREARTKDNERAARFLASRSGGSGHAFDEIPF